MFIGAHGVAKHSQETLTSRVKYSFHQSEKGEDRAGAARCDKKGKNWFCGRKGVKSNGTIETENDREKALVAAHFFPLLESLFSLHIDG